MGKMVNIFGIWNPNKVFMSIRWCLPDLNLISCFSDQEWLYDIYSTFLHLITPYY